MRSSARRRLAGTILLASTSILLTLVALEVTFRLAGVSVGTVQINRATVRRTDNPRLRFELRPGSAVRAEVPYRVNAEGLRGEETTVLKPAGVRRVAVLGDSIAFGYWVADEDGFPRQLERMLNVPGKAGDRIEVLNFGVPGYNLDQEIEALRTKALEFSPDLVVVAFCLNDLEGLFSYELGLVQDRQERSRSWPGRLWEGLLGRSRLLSWIEYRFSELEARRAFARAPQPDRRPPLRRGGEPAEGGASRQAERAAQPAGVAGHPGRSRRVPRAGRPLRAVPAPGAAPHGARSGRRGGPPRRRPSRLLLGLRVS